MASGRSNGDYSYDQIYSAANKLSARERKRKFSEVECSRHELQHSFANKRLKIGSSRMQRDNDQPEHLYNRQCVHSPNSRKYVTQSKSSTASHRDTNYYPHGSGKFKRQLDHDYETDSPNPVKFRKFEDRSRISPQAKRRVPMVPYNISGNYNYSQRKKKNGSFSSPPKPRDKSWMNNILTFKSNHIHSLTEMPVEQLVKELSNDIKAFQCTLDKPHVLKGAGVMDALIKVFSKIADPLTFSNESYRSTCLQILGEALSDRCANFQLHLKLYIKNDLSSCLKQNNVEKKILHLCKLFHNILLALPESSKSWLPAEDLQRAAEQLPNPSPPLLESMKDFKLHLDEVKEWHLKKTTKKEQNNCEFKEISIIPLWHEIINPQKPQLRKNIISGCYVDWLHYYDIQFWLMREDFVAPLRKGICDYLKGTQGQRIGDIRVYKKVLLREPTLLPPHGVCYKIKLSHLDKHIDWEHSKRLMNGSLLCLTPEHDNFGTTLFFATVINRDPNGELIVMFKSDERMLTFSCKGLAYTMVESCAYFEASRHILRSIQTTEVSVMPFTKYLIEVDFSSVDQPHYLSVNSDLSYNLTSLLTEEGKDYLIQSQNDTSPLSDGEIDDEVSPENLTTRNKCLLTKQVADFTSWPTCDQAALDASQLKAIHMALTQEIAVIQGPPGTGKTHIGVKIVEALLSNSKICSPHEPILVMCLTNHALDQFLEGVLNSPLYKNAPPRLIRIGGGSKSKELEKFNLAEVCKNVHLPRDVLCKRKTSEQSAKEFRVPKLNQSLSALKSLSTFSHEMLYEYDVISSLHYSQLFCVSYTPEQSSCVLEMWLGLECSNSSLNNKVDTILASYIKEQKTSSLYSNSQNGNRDTETSSQVFDQVDEENESNADSLIEVGVEQSNRIDDEYLTDALEEQFANHHDQISFDEYRKRCVIFDEDRAGKILNYGFSLAPMSKEESFGVKNIHQLDIPDRWRLYQYWHSKCLKKLCEECEEDFLRFNQVCTVLTDVRRNANRFALETAEIIGVTTTGAAKYQSLLHCVKPRIVIVEEAAEVLESHIVSALNAGTQHLIMIGDHKQLRPKPNDYELAKKYNLDISLFERLIRNDFPLATLECQHRMRPEIAELVKGHIYSTLSNHSDVESYPNIRGVSTNLFFINHDMPDERNENLSHSNFHEANYLVKFCRYLLQQQYSPEKITILVTYTGQLQTVRELMPIPEFKGVRVCTVDNFQGEENDIILLSLVRSNSEKKVGFLKEENRICVALSRARQGLYCIGNFDMLREKVPLWDKIVTDMEQKKMFGDGLLLHCFNHPKTNFIAKMPEDFEEKSPKGGCLQNCTYRLKCSHACAQKCHYSDPEHNNYVCLKQCTKKMP